MKHKIFRYLEYNSFKALWISFALIQCIVWIIEKYNGLSHDIQIYDVIQIIIYLIVYSYLDYKNLIT